MLPHARASAAAARRQLAAELRGAGLDPVVVDDAMVVVTELVGNAVLHGRPLADGAIRVEWEPHDTVVDIAITDGGGASRPVRRDADAMALSGRGLAMIGQLASRWGVDEGTESSTVWAVVGGDTR